MTVAELEVLLKADINDLKAALEEANQRLNRFDDNAERAADNASKSLKKASQQIMSDLQRIGTALSASVTLPVIALGKKSVDTLATFDSLERGIKSVDGTARDLGSTLRELDKLAKLPGLGMKEVRGAYVNLRAAGIEAETVKKAIGGFGNALATVGKGKAELDGVVLALSQIASKGKVSAEEINQIAERVPQIRTVMKEAFGTANTEELQKMGIASEQFIARVTDALAKLPVATGGVKNDLENLSDEFDRMFTEMGKAVYPLVKDISDSLVPALKQASQTLKDMTPEQRQMVVNLGLMAAAIGPSVVMMAQLNAASQFLANVGTWLTATRVGVAGVGAASVATTAGVTGLTGSLVALVTNPYVLLIAGIGVAVYAVKKAVDDAADSAKNLNRDLAIAAQKHADAARETLDNTRALKGLVDQYISLEKEGSKTREGSKRLQELLNEIGAKSPELVTGWDNQGNAIKLMRIESDKLVGSLKEQIKYSRIAATGIIATRMSDLADQRAALQDLIKVREMSLRGEKVAQTPDGENWLVPGIGLVKETGESLSKLQQRVAELTRGIIAAKAEMAEASSRSSLEVGSTGSFTMQGTGNGSNRLGYDIDKAVKQISRAQMISWSNEFLYLSKKSYAVCAEFVSRMLGVFTEGLTDGKGSLGIEKSAGKLRSKVRDIWGFEKWTGSLDQVPPGYVGFIESKRAASGYHALMSLGEGKAIDMNGRAGKNQRDLARPITPSMEFYRIPDKFLKGSGFGYEASKLIESSIKQLDDILDETRKHTENAQRLLVQNQVNSAKLLGDSLENIAALQAVGVTYRELEEAKAKAVKAGDRETLDLVNAKMAEVQQLKIALEAEENQRATQAAEASKRASAEKYASFLQSQRDYVAGLQREVQLLNATTELQRVQVELATGAMKDWGPITKALVLHYAKVKDEHRKAMEDREAQSRAESDMIEDRNRKVADSYDAYSGHIADFNDRIIEANFGARESFMRRVEAELKYIDNVSERYMKIHEVMKLYDASELAERLANQSRENLESVNGYVDQFASLMANSVFQSELKIKSLLGNTLKGISQFVADAMRELLKLQIQRGVQGWLGSIFGLGGSGGGSNSPAIFAPTSSVSTASPLVGRSVGGATASSRVVGYGSDQVAMAGAPIVVNVHISTPDAGSFRASQRQVTEQMAAAVQQAIRRR